GAGKTTTIRVMMGILKPTSGQVFLGGYDVERQPEEAKAISGFIPDRPFIYEKLSGLEFLQFVGKLHRVESVRLARRIHELLERFELARWKDELVESYSHGMKQRLVVCASLIHQPRILVVDEPMVGMDPKGARKLKDLFRSLSDQGTTVFLSTHSIGVAEEVCHQNRHHSTRPIDCLRHHGGSIRPSPDQAGKFGKCFSRIDSRYLRRRGSAEIADHELDCYSALPLLAFLEERFSAQQPALAPPLATARVGDSLLEWHLLCRPSCLALFAISLRSGTKFGLPTFVDHFTDFSVHAAFQQPHYSAVELLSRPRFGSSFVYLCFHRFLLLLARNHHAFELVLDAAFF